MNIEKPTRLNYLKQAISRQNTTSHTARGAVATSQPIHKTKRTQVQLQNIAASDYLCDVAPTGKFITAYTKELKFQILTAAYLVLDLETTNLTKFQTPIRVGKATRLAGTTYNQYHLAHPDCTVNTEPRTRIITLGLPGNTVLAFDFDALTPEVQTELAHDSVNNKILIGHNIGFDLSWLSHLTNAKPQRVLDSMVITKVFRHGLPVRIHANAATGHTESREFIQGIDSGLAGFSLESLCIAAGMPRPSKIYQKPQNWAVSELTPEHHAYVTGDVTEPLQVITTALRLPVNASMPTILTAIKGSIYESAYEPVIFMLAEIHRRGMPVDLVALDALMQKQADAIATAANTVIELEPAFEPVRDKLSATSGGLTAVVKETWKIAIEAAGLVCPTTAAGGISITQAAVKMCGITAHPTLSKVWTAWESLQGAKKRFGMLDELKSLASTDGKLHSLLGFNARTLRMSATAPNTQNFPRDEAFRAIVTAGDLFKILSVDYGQIELRLAAALALRAISEAKLLKSGVVYDAIRMAEYDAELEPLLTPEDCGKSKELWHAKTMRELQHAWRDMMSMGTPLAAVFQHGLDPHLLTAVETLRKQGILQFEGTAIAWLQAQDAGELKSLYKDARQQAKAQNFGLLYGMSAAGLHAYGITSYGLNWIEEEAVTARDAWFDAFPDVRIWHALINLNFSRYELFAKPQYAGYAARPDTHSQKIFSSKTLSGREVITAAKKDALNYSDQGSGADMICRAIALLPDSISRYLVNVIHDELLLCVPASKAEQIASEVEEIMNRAGDEFLAPWGIPCEAEAGISQVWEH